MLNLKELAGKRWKIVMDPSYEFTGVMADRLWYYRVDCRWGHVYPHSAELLGAYTDGRRRIGMMKAIPGIRLHQNGDREASFLFPPEMLDQVCAVLKARKRRPPMSEDQKAAAVARLSKFAYQPSRSPGMDSIDQDESEI